MTPRYYICKRWNPPTSGPYRSVFIGDPVAGDEMLVRIDSDATIAPAGASKLNHVMDHETPLHDDHVEKLAEHGVVKGDTTFKAMMKVAANHSDMEP